MRTRPRERADAAILVAHHDERLAEEIERDEIADFRELRNVRDAEPFRAQNVIHFPAVERIARVSGGGQSRGFVERAIGGRLQIGEHGGKRGGFGGRIARNDLRDVEPLVCFDRSADLRFVDDGHG